MKHKKDLFQDRNIQRKQGKTKKNNEKPRKPEGKNKEVTKAGKIESASLDFSRKKRQLTNRVLLE